MNEVQRLVEVKAPHDGCFYRAASPEAYPFVEIGDAVYPGDVVCIVEAMKLFNSVPYDGTPGIVKEIIVANNTSVKQNDVLMRVCPDPSLPPRIKPAKTVEGLETELTAIADSLRERLANNEATGD